MTQVASSHVASESKTRDIQKSKRTIRREDEAKRYAAARQFMADEGVSVMHLRLKELHPEIGLFASHTGGITVAYRRQHSTSFMEISTAICSERDIYDRKVGTIYAVEQFANQRSIRIPLFGAEPQDAIEHLFGGYLTFLQED